MCAVSSQPTTLPTLSCGFRHDDHDERDLGHGVGRLKIAFGFQIYKYKLGGRKPIFLNVSLKEVVAIDGKLDNFCPIKVRILGQKFPIFIAAN